MTEASRKLPSSKQFSGFTIRASGRRTLKRLAAVTTYGGTRMRAIMAGDPPRKCVTRAVWHVCRPRSMRYLALYDMNRATEAQRRQFLRRTRRELAVF